MYPKQRNRENSPYTCAYNFTWFLHICIDIAILREFPLQNKDQSNTHTHTHTHTDTHTHTHTHTHKIKLCIGVSLKSLQEL
jgi:hypothetical protein